MNKSLYPKLLFVILLCITAGKVIGMQKNNLDTLLIALQMKNNSDSTQTVTIPLSIAQYSNLISKKIINQCNIKNVSDLNGENNLFKNTTPLSLECSYQIFNAAYPYLQALKDKKSEAECLQTLHPQENDSHAQKEYMRTLLETFTLFKYLDIHRNECDKADEATIIARAIAEDHKKSNIKKTTNGILSFKQDPTNKTTFIIYKNNNKIAHATDVQNIYFALDGNLYIENSTDYTRITVENIYDKLYSNKKSSVSYPSNKAVFSKEGNFFLSQNSCHVWLLNINDINKIHDINDKYKNSISIEEGYTAEHNNNYFPLSGYSFSFHKKNLIVYWAGETLVNPDKKNDDDFLKTLCRDHFVKIIDLKNGNLDKDNASSNHNLFTYNDTCCEVDENTSMAIFHTPKNNWEVLKNISTLLLHPENSNIGYFINNDTLVIYDFSKSQIIKHIPNTTNITLDMNDTKNVLLLSDTNGNLSKLINAFTGEILHQFELPKTTNNELNQPNSPLSLKNLIYLSFISCFIGWLLYIHR